MLAAAAIAGVAFVLVQVMPRGGAGMPLPATSSGTADSAPPAISSSELPEAPPPSAIEESARKAAPPPTAGAAPKPPGAASIEPSSKSAKTVAGALERRTPAPATVAPSPDVADSLMSASPPATANREGAARIERIVTLYQAGDKSGAATELRALRADVEGVDARLPANLQAWARSVR
jgi:hypothetical protein